MFTRLVPRSASVVGSITAKRVTNFAPLAPAFKSTFQTRKMHIVHSDQAPKAVGPYSQAIVSGNHVFCSGQVHFNVAENKLISGSVAEQTHQCLTNLKAVLAAANPSKPLTLKNVIKTTVFLTDMKDFAEMNAAYAEAFDGHAPARSTIQVAGLPLGSRVEIEAIAAIDV